MEHAIASAEVRSENIDRSEHDKLAVHDASIVDQAAAVMRVHAVNLPADRERCAPVNGASAAHLHPSQFSVPTSPAGNGVSDVEQVIVLYVACCCGWLTSLRQT